MASPSSSTADSKEGSEQQQQTNTTTHIRPRRANKKTTTSPNSRPRRPASTTTSDSESAANPSSIEPSQGWERDGQDCPSQRTAAVHTSTGVKGILRLRPKYSPPAAALPPPSATVADASERLSTSNDMSSGGNDEGRYAETATVSGDGLVIVERRRTTRRKSRKGRGEGGGGVYSSSNSNGRGLKPPPSGPDAAAPEGTMILGPNLSSRPLSPTSADSASASSSASFEGGFSQVQQPEELDPLVFNSLYELMEHAGTLPEQEQKKDGGVPREGGAAASPTNDPSHGPSAATGAMISPGSVVEAELEFQCMDPDAWEMVRQQQEQEEEVAATHEGSDHDEIGPPRRSWLAALPAQGLGIDEEHNDDDDDDDGDDEEDQEDEDEDEEYFDFLRTLKEDRHNNPDYYSSDEDDDAHGGGSDDEDEEDDDGSERNHRLLESARKPPDRPPITTATPFLVLWTALSQWVTPQAARYVRAPLSPGDVRPFEPVLDADSDVIASRLGGLYAQLQMHVSASLLALSYTDNPRLAWIRLGDLLRCFSYARPMPNVDRSHLRALTTILLHSVLRNQDGFQGDDCSVLSAVPEPCAEVGLSLAEYLHLTKVLVNFGLDDDEDEQAAISSAGPITVPRPKNRFHE